MLLTAAWLPLRRTKHFGVAGCGIYSWMLPQLIADIHAFALSHLAGGRDTPRDSKPIAQVEEKVFALFQWLPTDANGMAKARASIHRSFVTSIRTYPYTIRT